MSWKTLRFHRSSLFVVTLVVLTCVPVLAAETEVIDRYSITAMGKGHSGLAAGKATKLTLVIYRWTTPEERRDIITMMGGPDGKAIIKNLETREVVGRLMIPGQPGVDLRYTWKVDQDGKTYVVGAAERSLLSEPGAVTGDAKFYVAVMQLELDASGKGTGTLAPGIEPVFYTNGTVKIEASVGDPIDLTRVVQEKPKKKKQ